VQPNNTVTRIDPANGQKYEIKLAANGHMEGCPHALAVVPDHSPPLGCICWVYGIDPEEMLRGQQADVT
jgi:hypothetical protein